MVNLTYFENFEFIPASKRPRRGKRTTRIWISTSLRGTRRSTKLYTLADRPWYRHTTYRKSECIFITKFTLNRQRS